MPRPFLFCALLTLLLPFPATAQEVPLAGIVLVISDGTSQELLTAARIYARGVKGHLALESFPQTAIVRTYSGSDVVTDSAAAATALARGIKADDRVVGMAHARSKDSPPSLLDLARKAGWSTGIVTDDSITGATEAPFLIEHGNRDENALIAAKMVDQLGPRADLLLGGGAKWVADLSGKSGISYEPGELPVVRATQAKLAAAKIAAFDAWQPFVDHVAKGGDDRPVLGTFSPVEFPYYADGLRSLRLADLATQAVRFLRAKERPFFLMIEAALPDKACHLGNAKRAIVEVLELDAMLEALHRELPPRILILATTDHNNGGLAINGPPVPLTTRGDTLLGRNPITNAASILTWATGPGFDQAKANVRERVVTEPNQPPRTVVEPRLPSDPDYLQPAAMAARAAMHTGGDVWLLGDGPGSDKVHGYLDNTDIYRIIAETIPTAPGAAR
ncbi:MAG: alkaline phosphatase [Terrimicrobiaceae bacterium]|nr:alkaline phosphatase [Terrimicrobiaceae bacterium]